MTIHASDCDTFVLLLVDADAAAAYLVDNQSGEGSTGEGTTSLTTQCGKGSKICWTAQTIVPCGGSTISSLSIGNSAAWGFSGQPQSAPDRAGAFTGQAQSATAASAYPMNVAVQLETGSLITPSVTPQIAVQGPSSSAPPSKLPRAAFRRAAAAMVAQETPCPHTMILVALDADRFRASSGTTGAFLVDNRLSNGSTNEGSPRLSTFCNAGDRVAFGVISINPYDGYTVTIDAIDVSAGSIFPGAEGPRTSAPSWWSGARGSLWIGRAVNSGLQSYALTLRVDDGIAPFTASLTRLTITCR